MSKYANIEQIKEVIRTEWVRYMPMELDISLSFVLGKISEVPTIEVSEDCISRSALRKEMEMYGAEITLIDIAPSVVPTQTNAIQHTQSVESVGRAEGEWQITDAYPHNVHCSECHKKFAQTHWGVWEDGSLPRNYCPNCGAKMKGERNDRVNYI